MADSKQGIQDLLLGTTNLEQANIQVLGTSLCNNELQKQGGEAAFFPNYDRLAGVITALKASLGKIPEADRSVVAGAIAERMSQVFKDNQSATDFDGIIGTQDQDDANNKLMFIEHFAYLDCIQQKILAANEAAAVKKIGEEKKVYFEKVQREVHRDLRKSQLFKALIAAEKSSSAALQQKWNSLTPGIKIDLPSPTDAPLKPEATRAAQQAFKDKWVKFKNEEKGQYAKVVKVLLQTDAQRINQVVADYKKAYPDARPPEPKGGRVELEFSGEKPFDEMFTFLQGQSEKGVPFTVRGQDGGVIAVSIGDGKLYFPELNENGSFKENVEITTADELKAKYELAATSKLSESPLSLPPDVKKDVEAKRAEEATAKGASPGDPPDALGGGHI